MADRQKEADFLYEAAARLRVLAQQCAAPLREDLMQFACDLDLRVEELLKEDH